MKKPKISVMIPTYNRADLIGITLSCVANQTVRPDEVVVIDNASTDNTKEIVQGFATYGIKYTKNKKNIGMAGNYNRCIERASNDYFTILPSDDLIAPDWCQKWKSVIAKHAADMYTSPIVVVDNSYTPLWTFPLFSRSRMIRQPEVTRTFARQFCPGIPPSAASIYTKSIMKKTGGFREDHGSECDVEIGMELFDRCDVYYYHRFLFGFREHEMRSFDEKKEARRSKQLTKIDNYFRIVSEYYSKHYAADSSRRHILQSHVFMTLCNVNLYIARGDISTIIGAYKLARTHFPDVFLVASDWSEAVRVQMELIRRGLFMKRIPKTYQDQVTWLSTIASSE